MLKQLKQVHWKYLLQAAKYTNLFVIRETLSYFCFNICCYTKICGPLFQTLSISRSWVTCLFHLMSRSLHLWRFLVHANGMMLTRGLLLTFDICLRCVDVLAIRSLRACLTFNSLQPLKWTVTGKVVRESSCPKSCRLNCRTGLLKSLFSDFGSCLVWLKAFVTNFSNT